MSSSVEDRLIKGLSQAHALEKQAVTLLELASSEKVAGDSEIAAIYSAHLLQTKEHARYVAERLEALGSGPSKVKDVTMQATALGLGTGLKAAPATPMRLAEIAFAFENLEVATYRFLHRLAERAGDSETVSVIERILEQEEAAVELVQGTFDRALEVTLGEEGKAPLIPVTPIGKPSERDPAASGGRHPGPQDAKETPSDKPIAEPAHVDSPTEGEHLRSPEPGHEVGEVNPVGGDVPDPEHPERIGSTQPDQQGA